MVVQAPLTNVYTLQHLFSPSSRPIFGGISPESNSFADLKRIMYVALDILTQEPREAEAFVTHICSVGDGGRYSFTVLNM